MTHTHRYALFGKPVAHSSSPFVYQSFAKQTGLLLNYEKIQPTGDFSHALRAFIQGGGEGGNVTIPFKQEAFNFADDLTTRAKVASAVNTFKILENGRVLGDNTDGFGLVTDLKKNLKVTIQGKQILLVGAGGAARGVLKPLLDEHPQSIIIVNRTPEKAVVLAKNFSKYGPIEAKTFSELTNMKFDLIINATSTGLSHESLPLADGILNQGACCYDMAYGKQPTPFMQWGRKQGAKIIADGLGMLVEQAAEAFFVFSAIRPETNDVYQHLREQLT